MSTKPPPYMFPNLISTHWSNYPATLNYPTLEEQQMKQLSWTIRQKPEWYKKYKNPEIVSKWRKEALSQPLDTGEPIREPLFDYVIEELDFYDRVREFTGNTFQIAKFDLVLFGDNCVSEKLKETFVKAAKKLEDVPEGLKDWHPGSDNRVLDLVHPSLYPLQYGVTPVVADLENDHVGFQTEYTGKCVPMPAFSRDLIYKVDGGAYFEASPTVSKDFQWLPSLFQVSKDGKVEIKSYINNLHPVHHKDLYQPIADIFSTFLPALNEMLCLELITERIAQPYDDPTKEDYFYDPPVVPPAPEDDPEYDFFDSAEYDHYMETRMPYVCDPKFEMPDFETSHGKFSIYDRELKVIVKLANIELTPERPNYDGGVWHMEGCLNEDIIATALYYYDCENITESRLMFRPGVREPEYAQGDDRGVRMIYGVEDGNILSYDNSYLEAIEDRSIVFPNVFQHKVAPFELKDKTKPGHRKILCFFLCDPFNKKNISTDQVPPQQQKWWVENITKDENDPKQTAENSIGSKIQMLPPEIQNEIFPHVDWPMTLEAAKEVRKKLMEQRAAKVLSDEDEDDPHMHVFSLCEH